MLVWPRTLRGERLADCAICLHLNEDPRGTAGTVGLLTAAPTILRAAIDHIGEIGLESHVVVHACPEHVVDVYRGRVAGVRMAWRFSNLEAETNPSGRRSPAEVSSSRA